MFWVKVTKRLWSTWSTGRVATRAFTAFWSGKETSRNLSLALTQMNLQGYSAWNMHYSKDAEHPGTGQLWLLRRSLQPAAATKWARPGDITSSDLYTNWRPAVERVLSACVSGGTRCTPASDRCFFLIIMMVTRHGVTYSRCVH